MHLAPSIRQGSVVKISVVEYKLIYNSASLLAEHDELTLRFRSLANAVTFLKPVSQSIISGKNFAEEVMFLHSFAAGEIRSTPASSY